MLPEPRDNMSSARRIWSWAALVMLGLLSGCSRAHYRVATDRNAYGLLAEKSVATPWQVPEGFNILPHPASRFFDPTSIEHPVLPPPAPHLYSYHLPILPSQMREPPRTELARRLPDVEEVIQQVAYLQAAADGAGPCEDERQPVPVIDRRSWEALPRSGVRRMLEFESVRSEYVKTFESEPPPELIESAERLTLEDIVYLALLNSREYQTQKENLYRSALALSFERYRFMLKFSTSGNGADANYQHSNVDGTSQSSLAAPASARLDKVLATGGDFVAQFANSVVLTFNGPQGFAADLTTSVLFDLTQSVFQRDIRLEALTAAERNVVYAARDYARFRKSLFVQLASQYYSLLVTYRQVEIAAQNYFQLVRAFAEREAELEAGQTSRVQVDQVEQQLLRGRSGLVQVTNSIENAIDALKIRMGLPTESLVNLDLTEIEELTLRDDLAVTGVLIRRTRDDRLLKERLKEAPDRIVLLTSSSVLVERMLRAYELQAQLGGEQVDLLPLQTLDARYQLELARNIVEQLRTELAVEESRDVTSDALLLRRVESLNQALIRLACRQLQLASLLGIDQTAVQELYQQIESWGEQDTDLRMGLEEMIEKREVGRIREFLDRARQLLVVAEGLARGSERLLGVPPVPPTPEERLAETIREVDRLLDDSGRLLAGLGGGLVPVEVAMDDAMLTALVLRLDLMNERGILADDWRRVKLAADELKSILNLQASQFLGSSRDLNAPFGDQTIDTTRTQVSISFDAPLNRRAQRNAYRRALIDYNAGLRSLMQAEDTIKLDIRRGLRNLDLAKDQYEINVASAALAFERVVSTETELRLRVANVSARDFLESQSAYIEALSQVASRHIDYILDRMQLFFDMELMEVDDRGLWNALNDEAYQPQPYYQLPTYALPAYGELPAGVWHSHLIRSMYDVPTGVSTLGPLPDESSEPSELAPEPSAAPVPLPEPAPES